MLLKGEVAIRTPRKCVWDFLTDPDQIGQYVPGVNVSSQWAGLEVNEGSKRGYNYLLRHIHETSSV